MITQLVLGVILVALEFSATISILAALVITLIFVLMSYYAIKGAWRTYRRNGYETPSFSFKRKDVLYIILFVAVIRVVAILLTFIMEKIYGETQTANDDFLIESLTKGVGSNGGMIILIVAMLSISLMVPIAEELIFRGMFKEMLFKRTQFYLPLIVSAIIFGSMHTSTNLISWLIYFVMGICIYLSYARRGNIIDSIIVHIINNSIACISIAVAYL